MHVISNYVALILAALFGAIGLVHLAGPRFVREAYERWEYSQNLRRIVGFLEIIAAAWLADPVFRLWGIGLAAAINFGGVVTLLNHRQYLHAGPGLVMMLALLPATLAVPGAHPVRFIAIMPAPVAQQQATPRQDDLEAARDDARAQPSGG
ncbi:MAG TPA: DoxX family protein [Micropepsaceae bacterium]